MSTSSHDFLPQVEKLTCPGILFMSKWRMVWEMTEGLVLSPQLCRCYISVIGEKIAEHEIKVVNLPASQHFYPHIWP